MENKECNYHVKPGRQVGDSETTVREDNERTVDNLFNFQIALRNTFNIIFKTRQSCKILDCNITKPFIRNTHAAKL